MTNFIGIDEVKKRTALSKSSIYDFVRRNIFPQPIKIAERRIAWIEDEIDTWLAEKIKAART